MTHDLRLQSFPGESPLSMGPRGLPNRSMKLYSSGPQIYMLFLLVFRYTMSTQKDTLKCSPYLLPIKMPS